MVGPLVGNGGAIDMMANVHVISKMMVLTMAKGELKRWLGLSSLEIFHLVIMSFR